jgi:hypothetical protein
MPKCHETTVCTVGKKEVAQGKRLDGGKDATAGRPAPR